MLPVYATCKEQSGKGCLNRMKNDMAEFLYKNKSNIFKGAEETLLNEFDKIQVTLIYSAEVFCTL